MKRYLGIAIGGTKCMVSLGQEEKEELKLLGSRRVPTPQGIRPEEILLSLAEEGAALLRENGVTAPDAVGIACGSPLDSEAGVIQCPPNLPDWIDVPAAGILSRYFGVPAFLENDANGGALAEWKYGAGRGADNVIFLTFGTGFGAGLILDGRLYRGRSGMAGEVGHVRLCEFGPVGYGKAGTAEGFCSGGGIAQLAVMKCREAIQTGIRPDFCRTPEELEKLTAADVAKAAREGSALAREIYALSGKMLGRTLAMLVDLFNPEKIVIGSIFARAEELLRPAMEEELRREALPMNLSACRILPAALGDRIDEYEALSIAAYGLQNQAGGEKA